MTLEAPMRCSAVAEQLGEPMAGSADERRRWLLVEDRSAWGEKAVRDVLGAPLERRAADAGIRPLLVRRREADPAADAVRRVVLADVPTGRMATRTIRDVAELDPLLDAEPDAFGEPLDGPLFLICTNGKRDACCALRGRIVLAAIAARHPGRTWECTHLGGHRFAASLLCLPDGLVYGRVTPVDGARLADAALDGRLEPAFLRGRSSWPAPAQVAEVELRTRLGLTGARDVELLSCAIHGDLATVSLRVAEEAHRLDLVAERLDPPRPVSCRADELERPLAWRVAGTP